MKRLLRHWKLLLFFTLAAAGLLLVRNNAANNTPTIATAVVRRGDFVNTLSSSGKTKADRSVELKFQTSGKLAWVGVTEGASVSAYQAIARLDDRELQKNLEKSLRSYANKRNDFDQAGLDSPAIKPSDAANDRIRRILQKNQWDLEQAVLDVELKNLALELSTLITPIAGIVTRVDTPVAGVNITPATAVFVVSDPTSLIFEANVDETDISGLSVGQSATISLDAFPEATFSGTISYISYTSRESAGGATVFPIKVAFDNPQNLRIGLNGDITIATTKQPHVLTVPIEAIREEKGKTFVYRKVGNTFIKTPVSTGPKNEDDIVITAGLNEGDIVVTKGFSNIRT